MVRAIRDPRGPIVNVDVVINKQNVFVLDKIVELCASLGVREFDLLHVLALNKNIVLTRDQLLDQVWGYNFEVNTNVVDVFVGYLRKKLEINNNPRMVETVRGVGFVLKT